MEYFDLQPRKPVNIALSFSGGGFRAATYSLGCLSYMDRLNIGNAKFTSLVSFISSASGGTITSLSYTAAQRKGEAFIDYYDFMVNKLLCDSRLVSRVFEIMDEERHWKGRKSRNLINAFAIAYDELIFQREQFGVLFEDVPGCVKEVCVNATEFDNAMLFRFQNIRKHGNHYLYFPDSGVPVLKKIKLGDILAASSCFPVGFEPIMYPRDFCHEGLTEAELQSAITSNPATPKADGSPPGPANFGLMDGGIDDNQGIDSFIRAEERMQDHNDFGYDLYLSCDVSSNFTNGFKFPEENKESWLQRLSILGYLSAVIVLCCLSILGVAYNIVRPLSYALLGVSVFLLLLAGIAAWQLVKKRNFSARKRSTFGILIFRHLWFFLRLRLSVLLQILDSRATSAAYLASVVFLKKIRRISYDRLFGLVSETAYDAAGNKLKDNERDKATRIQLKHWKNFAMQNAIYLLTRKNNAQRTRTLRDERWPARKGQFVVNGESVFLSDMLLPSIVLQDVAEQAADMDTTLWFDEHHMADRRPAALIATGQFTTCYNLLRYTLRFDSADAYWSALQQQLAADWLKFNADPYWMYEDYNQLIHQKNSNK